MSDNPPNEQLSRRKFLGTSAVTAGLVGVGAVAVVVATRRTHARQRTNPFAYNVDQFRKTDPALIHYQQVSRIPVPREEPRRIAIGPDDLLHVAVGNYISIFDSGGNPVSEIALSAASSCLGVAKDRTILVGFRDHVEAYSLNGQRTATWDAPSGKPYLTGIAIGDQEVFVADAGNRVVLRYDRSGKLEGRIGEKNVDRNVPGFVVPSPFFDVDLAPDGLLRVGNPGRHRVEAYTTKGDLEFFWGKASLSIEGFCGCCNPINLAMMPDGRCVTCEKGLPRVKVYDVSGAFESVVAGPESFPENVKACSGDASECHHGGLDAAVDSHGRIYVLDLVAKDVRVMARMT